MSGEVEAKSPRVSEVVMTQMILPSDANALNTAFGGRLMEWIDVAGAIAAQRHCRNVVVTASVDEVHFHHAVQVGWNVTLRARVLAAFKTSVEVGVTATAENPFSGEEFLTTTALMTFVTRTATGEKAQVPPLILETEEEKAAAADAQKRREDRIGRARTQMTWQKLLLG